MVWPGWAKAKSSMTAAGSGIEFVGEAGGGKWRMGVEAGWG